MTLRILLIVAFLFVSVSSFAGSVNVQVGYGGINFDQPIRSYKEKLFDSVVRQKYDFSCGSAALATLLYHHYYYDVDERQVLHAMYEAGDRQQILLKGFSLLDMKSYLASVGIHSDGYQMKLDKLEKIGIPSIALINNNGYLHFVVLRGIFKDYVLLGDPSLGNHKVRRPEFEKMWNGIAFVIKDDISIARGTFNLASDWNSRGKISFGSALLDESLANITSDAVQVPNYYSF